jgi:hypothetical protein
MAVVLSGLVRASVIDDSFIAARYAANLVAGHGLVFNVGERVEGFSDLLWTLLLTVPVSLGFRTEVFALVVGVISGALAFYIAYRAAVRVGGVAPPLALAVTLACMFNVDFWTTCTNGLESGLFALLAILSLVLWWEKRLLAAGVVLGVLVFVRPEALMLAPLLALAAVLTRPASEKPQLSFLWAWATLAAASFLFRLAYFHALLPNSVTAKSHPLALKSLVLGLVYASRFSSGIAVVLVLAMAALFTRFRTIACIALLWMTAQFLVVVMNGGDWMPGFRWRTRISSGFRQPPCSSRCSCFFTSPAPIPDCKRTGPSAVESSASPEMRVSPVHARTSRASNPTSAWRRLFSRF